MKTEIIANLRDFTARHGIVFTSQEDALDYYQETRRADRSPRHEIQTSR